MEHVFFPEIASEKGEAGSSLVKGLRPSSILPLSCFTLLEVEDRDKKGERDGETNREEFERC